MVSQCPGKIPLVDEKSAIQPTSEIGRRVDNAKRVYRRSRHSKWPD